MELPLLPGRVTNEEATLFQAIHSHTILSGLQVIQMFVTEVVLWKQKWVGQLASGSENINKASD